MDKTNADLAKEVIDKWLILDISGNLERQLTELIADAIDTAREQGSAAERVEIVAWLRRQADMIDRRLLFPTNAIRFRAIAFEIERGEHDKAGDE